MNVYSIRLHIIASTFFYQFENKFKKLSVFKKNLVTEFIYLQGPFY